MNRVFTTLVVLFALFLYNCNTQPKLEIIGGDTHDWGKVTPKDDPLKATIEIKNAGTDSLIISEVKPSCGCTTAPIENSRLAPGQKTHIDITLKIGSAAHDLSKTVRISSNDPKDPNRILFLKAKVFHPIEVNPSAYFTFNEMKVGTEGVSTLKVKNNTEKNVTLSNYEITPTDLNFNLNQAKELKPGEEIEIIAKYKPTKAGYFNCTVKMKTTCPDLPELSITGYGNVKESSIFQNQ